MEDVEAVEAGPPEEGVDLTRPEVEATLEAEGARPRPWLQRQIGLYMKKSCIFFFKEKTM